MKNKKNIPGTTVEIGVKETDTGKFKRSCEIEELTEPCTIVIFGASGDLTRRKLVPSLYYLYTKKLLPPEFLIVGTGRHHFDNDDFRKILKKNIKEFGRKGLNLKELSCFIDNIFYHQLDYNKPTDFSKLDEKLNEVEKEGVPWANRIYYLATPPEKYSIIAKNLGISGLSKEGPGWSRLVVEKPFGRDLDSARQLNEHIHLYFRENQVYRIDHYLGKETVQDILMFRFANSIFEPVWNRQFIDHVQITASETLGVEHRAGYYDHAGVLRDMFQNHMMQLVGLTAMEPPVSFDAESVRDEKVKIFKSIRPFNIERLNQNLVIGQYSHGEINGEEAIPYRTEEEVPPDSITPTYAAMKLYLDNWRWKGVPFYLRSGKRLKQRRTEIAIQFKHVPHILFQDIAGEDISPNVLVFTIQPDEKIELTFQTKIPGSKVCMRTVTMSFRYSDFYSGVSLDSYERVLMDCLSGDHTLFVREDGIDATWKVITPILEALESAPEEHKLEIYRSGSYGPSAADQMIKRDGRFWRDIDWNKRIKGDAT